LKERVLIDQLMMSYAVIQLFLHVTENFLRSADIFVSVHVASLSDTQQRRSELLQLTAGDAHRSTVNGRHTIKDANPWE